ncbi:MAG TPA: hypothetical protein VFI31_09530 [Pirellulales bacterium]|nr:hypothetical protein [Pirellulales bacterium]
MTVLPRSRKEDESFRARLREDAAVGWQTVYDVTDGEDMTNNLVRLERFK